MLEGEIRVDSELRALSQACDWDHHYTHRSTWPKAIDHQPCSQLETLPGGLSLNPTQNHDQREHQGTQPERTGDDVGAKGHGSYMALLTDTQKVIHLCDG